MKKSTSLILCICFAFWVGNQSLFSQTIEMNSDSAGQKERTLPFGANWANKKGINLPLPFGVSFFTTYMTRDIDVTDVSVQFMDREPQSISDFSSFAVRNHTFVTAVKLDTWILPVVNLYLLAGYAGTNADLNVDVTIERPVAPGPPVVMNIQTRTKVKGPYFGAGSSIVAGYKNWFLLLDANYGKTWPDELNNSVNFTFLSARSGFSGNMGNKNTIKTWLGAAYLNSKTTLEIKEYSDVLGDVMLNISQQPVEPWTFHCGLLAGIGKKMEFMVELGTNFNDASVFVANVAYRF